CRGTLARTAGNELGDRQRRAGHRHRRGLRCLGPGAAHRARRQQPRGHDGLARRGLHGDHRRGGRRRGRRPHHDGGGLMNPTLIGLELKRIGRDYVGLFFIAVLPAFMYVVFGAAQTFAEEDIGRGNVALYIMISMAVYGAVTATVSVGGMAAVERMQGWGRQLGLTPLRDVSYVGTKAVVAMTIALIPIGLIYVIGLFTGA